jgi:hypothetical protein
MRKSKFAEEQIIGILREAEGQTPVKAVCARHNVSEATFYKWRAKYGGMDFTGTPLVFCALKTGKIATFQAIFRCSWAQNLVVAPGARVVTVLLRGPTALAVAFTH